MENRNELLQSQWQRSVECSRHVQIEHSTLVSMAQSSSWSLLMMLLQLLFVLLLQLQLLSASWGMCLKSEKALESSFLLAKHSFLLFCMQRVVQNLIYLLCPPVAVVVVVDGKTG